MRTRPRSVPGALVLGLALLLGGAGTAGAGDLMPIVACDSLATSDATAFDLFLWTHGVFNFCRVEVRPDGRSNIPPLEVLSWVMPEGWSAEWLPEEPGAIAITGCTNFFSPVMRIVFAKRVGSVEARFFNDEGTRGATWVGTIRCDSDTVPALPVSWGAVKSLYR